MATSAETGLYATIINDHSSSYGSYPPATRLQQVASRGGDVQVMLQPRIPFPWTLVKQEIGCGQTQHGSTMSRIFDQPSRPSLRRAFARICCSPMLVAVTRTAGLRIPHMSATTQI